MLNESRVKFITSHDIITARNLYEEPFDFTLTFRHDVADHESQANRARLPTRASGDASTSCRSPRQSPR